MSGQAYARLVGRWVIDPADSHAIEALGQASLDFREDGSLTYSTLQEDRIQTMFLTYRVVGDEVERLTFS